MFIYSRVKSKGFLKFKITFLSRGRRFVVPLSAGLIKIIFNSHLVENCFYFPIFSTRPFVKGGDEASFGEFHDLPREVPYEDKILSLR